MCLSDLEQYQQIKKKVSPVEGLLAGLVEG